MMKHEFETLVNEINATTGAKAKTEIEVSQEEYDIIETVYNWHPCITNVAGKNQIAMIYCYGGMQTIRDMAKTAESFKGFEADHNAIDIEVNAKDAEITAKIRELQNEREAYLKDARERQSQIRKAERELRTACK